MAEEKCKFFIRDEDGGEDCGKPAVKQLAYNDAPPRVQQLNVPQFSRHPKNGSVP
jgi:hypothetical protein